MASWAALHPQRSWEFMTLVIVLMFAAQALSPTPAMARPPKTCIWLKIQTGGFPHMWHGTQAGAAQSSSARFHGRLLFGGGVWPLPGPVVKHGTAASRCVRRDRSSARNSPGRSMAGELAHGPAGQRRRPQVRRRPETSCARHYQTRRPQRHCLKRFNNCWHKRHGVRPDHDHRKPMRLIQH